MKNDKYMSSDTNSSKIKDNTESQTSFDPAPDTEFLREKIKQKPINKKKLLRRTLITVLTAAIFGIVACVTFLLLEPLISSKLNNDDAGEQEVSTVVLPDEEDEIKPEDMYANDSEMIEEAIQGNTTEVNKDIQNIEEMISNISFNIDDYRNLYSTMSDLAESASHSVVTVTGYKTETDLLNNSYTDNTDNSTNGLIVADNGPSLLVFVKDNGISDADNVQVLFDDGTSAEGYVIAKDDATAYLIVSVYKSGLSDETRKQAVPAQLGTSRSTSIKGMPVIAIGSPTGLNDSISYGVITSDPAIMDMTDSDYTLITTDMVGADSASGILISLRGYVIGILDNSFESNVSDGLLTAVGITELKPLIEKLSNNTAKAYLGIHGMDVTDEMRNVYGLPDGIYLSSIEMDSPAMDAGLQNGDILVAVNSEKPDDYHDFIDWLNEEDPGDNVALTVRRQSVDSYISLTVDVTLGSIEYTTEEMQ